MTHCLFPRALTFMPFSSGLPPTVGFCGFLSANAMVRHTVPTPPKITRAADLGFQYRHANIVDPTTATATAAVKPETLQRELQLLDSNRFLFSRTGDIFCQIIFLLLYHYFKLLNFHCAFYTALRRRFKLPRSRVFGATRVSWWISNLPRSLPLTAGRMGRAWAARVRISRTHDFKPR